MAPNGMMQVATGLLLRTANEAQLAYVLGHELGHYRRRHSMQRWSDFQAKAGNLGPEPAAWPPSRATTSGRPIRSASISW